MRYWPASDLDLQRPRRGVQPGPGGEEAEKRVFLGQVGGLGEVAVEPLGAQPRALRPEAAGLDSAPARYETLRVCQVQGRREQAAAQRSQGGARGDVRGAEEKPARAHGDLHVRPAFSLAGELGQEQPLARLLHRGQQARRRSAPRSSAGWAGCRRTARPLPGTRPAGPAARKPGRRCAVHARRPGEALPRPGRRAPGSR